MKFLKLFISALYIFLISACDKNENEKLIIGKWSGAEWRVNGVASNHNTAQTHFTFDDKGNYTFTYATNVEKGTYKVENEMLFTKPENQQEIMVKIQKVTKNSLVFDMNRSGAAEILTLLKDK